MSHSCTGQLVWTAMFKRVFEKSTTLSFSADYIKSCACLEVCRQVAVAFDSSGMGRINFSDFKNLMCRLDLSPSPPKNAFNEKYPVMIRHVTTLLLL